MLPESGTSVPISGKNIPETELAIPYDLSTDRGAYEAARAIGRRLIMVAQQDCITVDAAISSISRRYRLGTFLEQIWKGKPAKITVARWVRLNRAWGDLQRSIDERREHDRAITAHLKRVGL